MKIHTKTILLYMVLAASVLLIACGDDKHLKDLRDYIANLKQTIAKTTVKAAPPEMQIPQPAIYQAKTQRSPFAGSEVVQKGVAATPLQSYSLNSLEFKGTVTQDNQTIAYIQTPDNKLYPVKIGDIIDDHYGKIVNISADHIEVQEQSLGVNGPATQRIETLQLKDESQ